MARGTLTQLVREYGTGTKTAAHGTAVDNSVHPLARGLAPPVDKTPEQELARLRVRG